MNLPLEDTYLDILRKAQRGNGLSDPELVMKSGVDSSDLAAVLAGAKEEKEVAKLAAALGLAPDRVVRLMKEEYVPEPVSIPEGFAMFNTPFDDMTVNSYLAWDTETKEAVAFDAGTDVTEMLNLIKSHDLKVKYVLLTHSHGDHIFDLERLVEKTGAEAWIGDREPFDGANRFSTGKAFVVGKLNIGTRLTAGHAVGGITYVVAGLSIPLAIVGDAIFAGSMGGGMVSYQEALRTNAKEIFSLSDDTILASGHGPLTTVGEQRANNPFFPNV